MSTSNESFQLITEREEIETLINENEVTIDSKIKYEL
jgi:hypothetical protein